MTKRAKREYVDEIRPRYRQTGSREERGALLDEMVKVTKFNRKYLIRLLHKQCDPTYPKAIYVRIRKKGRGRPRIYTDQPMIGFLITLWHATNQACSKRLRRLLPLWLPHYANATGVTLSLLHQALLLRMTHTTIDRLLAEERSKYRIDRGRCTTKPGTLLKHRIPIRTEQWKERRPGCLEGDTVAHCGTSLAGMFAYTLNATDIATGWDEARAMWGKGEKGAVEAFQSIEEALPFDLREFDSDNGSEFLNHHFHAYLQERHRRVRQTRSREYKKNDNAHIEQKNWTHIRQLLGYERFDNPAVVDQLNDLYANEYSLLMNFFLPSVKLTSKIRIGSAIKKQHDQPMTPCDRLLTSRFMKPEQKQRLKTIRQSLNPFLLHEAIQRKVKAILKNCSLRTLKQKDIVHPSRSKSSAFPGKKNQQFAFTPPTASRSLVRCMHPLGEKQ